METNMDVLTVRDGTGFSLFGVHKLPSTYSFSSTADVVITCLHSVPSGTMSHCSVANRYDPLIRSAIVVGFGAASYSHCQSSRCV
jgi:hypothetical protein